MDWLLLDTVQPKLTTERSILCPGAPSITQGDWGEPQFVSSVTELDRVPGHVESFSDVPRRQRLRGRITGSNTQKQINPFLNNNFFSSQIPEYWYFEQCAHNLHSGCIERSDNKNDSSAYLTDIPTK